MRRDLLKTYGDDHFFKANLHNHTVISDGSFTPEEIKEHFMERGYSIVAFTDHDAYVPHNDLTDEKFLALNGVEYEAGSGAHVYHACFIAKTNDIVNCPFYHRTDYIPNKSRPLMKFDESLPDYDRIYSPEWFNHTMDEAHRLGFFATYNHPVWSVENYEQYSKYKGMDCMEIFNYGCIIEGFPEENPMVYDDLLRLGNRISCMSTDDNHSDGDEGGGYVVICAKSLTYPDVIDALEKGNFYSCCSTSREGSPDIAELYLEDNMLTVKTREPVKAINYSTASRRCLRRARLRPEDNLTQETFKVVPEIDGYFRIMIEDFRGGHTYTNAYFTDELFK